MIALRRHTSHDYMALPDIDAPGVGTLTEHDKACLNELGFCLFEANANERFGVTLLHSHFPIEQDETMVEEVHVADNVIHIRPVRSPSADLEPINISFEESSSEKELPVVGLHFVSSGALDGISPINESDELVLRRLAQILTRNEKLSRFGVRLLHDPLKLNGHTLVETCDDRNRLLVCRTVSLQDPTLTRSIPTVFQWEKRHAKDAWGASLTCTPSQHCEPGPNLSHTLHEDHKRSGPDE
jgi:hypothetical protein